MHLHPVPSQNHKKHSSSFWRQIYLFFFIYINIRGLKVRVQNITHRRGDGVDTKWKYVTSSQAPGRRPPAWAPWAPGRRGTPPRACSGQTSWTPATAPRARRPPALARRRNAPAVAKLQLDFWCFTNRLLRNQQTDVNVSHLRSDQIGTKQEPFSHMLENPEHTWAHVHKASWA